MMGTKARAFAPLPPVTLEDLVPPDHVYRRLDRTLDLAFVGEVVRADPAGRAASAPAPAAPAPRCHRGAGLRPWAIGIVASSMGAGRGSLSPRR